MIYLIFRFKKERQLIFDLFRTDESCDNLHFVYKDNFEIFKQQAKLHMKAIKEPLQEFINDHTRSDAGFMFYFIWLIKYK